jgi:transposase InsO family protein
MDKITMNRKEREQLIVLNRVENKEISQKTAAQMLGISVRWVREKLNRYRAAGDVGLVHKGRGRSSAKRWDPKESEFTLDLLRGPWAGFGPRFTSEKLYQVHGIKKSSETIRQLMRAHGIDYGTRRRRKRRKRRERKELLGLMVQLDGSPHDWFEGRGSRCTLLVFIDDATSKILWLEFAPSESLKAVMSATKNYFKKWGKPAMFYVDRGSVFRVNTNNNNHFKLTQFERAMDELGVKIAHAGTPQAKGRVERCNRTMQDRLIKEMRLAGISTLEQANYFLQSSSFIEDHNAAYAEPAAQKGNAHLLLDEHEIDDALTIKEQRTVLNDYTIFYQNKILQLKVPASVSIRPQDTVTVREHLDDSLSIATKNHIIPFRPVGSKKTSPVEHVLLDQDYYQAENNLSSAPEMGANSSLLSDIERVHLNALIMYEMRQ